MSASNDPSASVAQPETGAAPLDLESSVPLPPMPAPPQPQTAELLAREMARLDSILVVVVLLLSFLLASSVARNIDLWMHLGTGKLLAQGQVKLGEDPFSYTSTGPWINHSWLFDLMLYGAASLTGQVENSAVGAAFVFVKALLLTLLAWVLMQIRRPGLSLWIPAACTALAFLVLSPRALLQPTCFSFLFLGVTLYLLHRPEATESTSAGTAGPGLPFSRRWLLPPLFVLWVNLDTWFLFGPITVALYLLGDLLQRTLAPVRTGPDAPAPGAQRTLLLVFLVGLAACLINPYHYRAFTLPPELFSPTLDAIHAREPRLFPFYSPLNPAFYAQRAWGYNPAGMAYFLLLALGLVSFVLNRGTWRWWRASIWLAFALLSIYQVRLIPFFAIVAGPITALNLQDFGVERFGREVRLDRRWRQWSLGGRIVTVLVVVLLIGAAWPGWLHGLPDDPRNNHRVGWRVEVDGSLHRMARQLSAWRAAGVLPEGFHGFNYSPDIANYCAWFCPEEKGFFDYRFQLFRDVVPAYMDVRESLRPESGAGDGNTRPPVMAPSYPRIFRDYHINHVILYENYFGEFGVRARLLANPFEWRLIHLDGQVSVFAWRDPQGDVPSDLLQAAVVNPDALAFGPDLREEVRAPDQGPPQPPGQPTVWQSYWKGPAARPLDADTAVGYLEYYQIRAQLWYRHTLATIRLATWTGAVGQAGAGGGTVAAQAAAALEYRFPINYTLQDQGQGPPGPLLLAIRAARRAIAASPDHPQGYLGLAHAYTMLWRADEDARTGRPSRPPLSARQTLRQVQAVSALSQALALRPDAEDAHFLLSDIYRQIGYFDLALEHMRDGVKFSLLRGPRLAEAPERFEQRKKQLENSLKEIETDVQRRSNKYEVSAASRPLAGKMQLALEAGLAKEALQLLINADPLQIGPQEADWQIKLLLTMGRLDHLRAGMGPELQLILGFNYEWYNALLAAAAGDYQQAGKHLDACIAQLVRGATVSTLYGLRAMTFQGMIGPATFQSLQGIGSLLRQIADFRALRGLLALEEGDTATAERSFREALATNAPSADASKPVPESAQRFMFDSRPIVERYLAKIEAARK